MLRSSSTYDLRRLGHEPVGRQASDADQRAEHGGQHDAGDRDPHGVAEPTDEGVPHALGRAETAAGDREAGPAGRGSRS